MATELEIIWLAGLLEGEGCFSRKGNHPMIRLVMTDYDVVVKSAKIMNIPKYRIYVSNRKAAAKYLSKTAYILAVSGTNAIKWMKLIRPYMCERRSKKIDEIVSTILLNRPNIEDKNVCVNGHSVRFHWEYYLRGDCLYKECKKCKGIKVPLHIESSNDDPNYVFINPFKKVANA